MESFTSLLITTHSITACQRCRDHKVKCSRERPACARCQRLQADCTYPRPPVRRGRKLRRSSQGVRRVADQSAEQLARRVIVSTLGRSASGAQESTAHPSPRSNELTSPRHYTPHNENGLAQTENQARSEAAGLTRGTPRSGGWPSYLANDVGVESINVSSESYSTHLRNMNMTREGLTSDVAWPPLPPRALGLSLLDIYFTRIYNASVLFFKPILFQQYLDGKIPEVLLKALFALATLFLTQANEDSNDEQFKWSELKLLSTYSSCGVPWARSALREAMPSICTEPSLAVLQALHCLQLYWFGIGESRTGHLCLTLAYRSCDLLGYNRKVVDGVEKSDSSLESESRRRCFWACWMSTSIVMEPEPYARLAWQEASMIPLPAAILYPSSAHEVASDEKMDHTWRSSLAVSQCEDYRSPVYAALLVKMVGVWVKTQLLVRDWASSSIAQNLDSLQRLSHLARSIFENEMSSVDTETSRSDHSMENTPLVLFTSALYHQCQIALHSMVVPLFSGTHHGPTIDPEIVKQSAETVIQHAELCEALLAPYMYGPGDVTLLPPFVGYAAFITGVVFLAIEVSFRDKTSRRPIPGTLSESRRLSTVKGTLRLLNKLRCYWRALQLSWEKLDAALQLHLSCYRTQHELTVPHPVRAPELHPSTPKSQLSDPVREQSADNEQSRHREASVPPIGPSDQHLHPWVSGRRTLEVDTIQQTPQATMSDNCIFEQSDMEAADMSFTRPSGVAQDDPWYNLSFAEAGIEQFAGFEPLHLFQQGCGFFS
ncbi:hypothetical protein BDV27DRAFT_165503 [Aspergillus caelatus]|uniref:Zn(2)-C6 fungal-type domain-containing protein n=1 Tax=Aspergillus caelatus TaxID=61420 RepID=A0A5N7A1D3_9EURO|nr:uncharacterized protein BDV27DRAFT_165503 [Aspergillus caelatus]KAE8363288.1 hypothetical protein BDV27DRAFT_165503 [Aspergillus caelatus]